MKLLLLFSASVFLLIACQSENTDSNQNITEPPLSNDEPLSTENDVFTAEIISINGRFATVFASDIQGYPGGVNIDITLPEETEWETGEMVRVTHEGIFMESDPVQINMISVEKVN